MGLTSLGRCPYASRGGRGIGSWQQPNEKIKGALRPCLAAPFITEPTTLAKLLGENRSASCLTERALNTVVEDTRPLLIVLGWREERCQGIGRSVRRVPDIR